MHGVTGFVESAALLVFAAFVLVTICSRRAQHCRLHSCQYRHWPPRHQPDCRKRCPLQHWRNRSGAAAVRAWPGILVREARKAQEACLRPWSRVGCSHDDNRVVDSESDLRSRARPRNPHRQGHSHVIHGHVPQGARKHERSGIGQGRLAIAVLLFRNLAAVAFLLLHDRCVEPTRVWRDNGDRQCNGIDCSSVHCPWSVAVAGPWGSVALAIRNLPSFSRAPLH